MIIHNDFLAVYRVLMLKSTFTFMHKFSYHLVLVSVKKKKKKINKYKIKIEYLFKTHKEEKINSSIQDLKLTEVLLHSVRFSRPANSIICFYYLFLFLLVYFCPCFMRLKVSQNRHLKTASGSQTKHILCACPESKFMLLK